MTTASKITLVRVVLIPVYMVLMLLSAKNGFRAAKDAAAVDDEGYWSELEERVLRDADGANGTGSANGTGNVNGTGSANGTGNESGCGGQGGGSGEAPGSVSGEEPGGGGEMRD